MKFNPTSETARQEVLEYAKTQLSIDDARKILESNGYFVANLWHVYDVTSTYRCTNEQAYGILNDALTNEYIMEQIWDAIDSVAEDLNLEKNEND
jgi:hypothetical protein